jgi:D-xylose 1-dehydrogenase (NADP+, D-xylono-1,5-lactone-forming)
MRLGLVSTANINRMIIGGAAESSEVEVVAVGSRDGAQAQAYASEYGIPRSHASYEALLEDPDVDAVYISLPNGLHHEWTMKSIDAGKHVLVEKPYSRRAAEVEEAWDAAERAGLIVMEAFMYRHHPQIQRAKELVESGAVGRLRLIRTWFSFLLRDLTNVRMLPELDGGALMDVGCYTVSGARLFGGEPEKLVAHQVTGPTGVDVDFYITARFPNDVVARLDSSFTMPRRQRLEAIGEEGSVVLEAPWRVDWGGDFYIEREDGIERIDVPEANPYRLELENLARAIRGEEPPLLGRDDALGQARMIEAAYRSAAAAEVITF